MTHNAIDCILLSAENCLGRLEEVERELEKLPKGSVVMHKKHKGNVPYLHYYCEGKVISTRIEEQQLPRITGELEFRKRLTMEEKYGRDFLCCNKGLIAKCYEIMKANIASSPGISSRGKESQNNFNQGDKFHVSIRKEHMRSRAEVTVANCLYSHRVEYTYEAPLVLGGKTYYPDFTVVSPLLQHKVYIEYCGLNTPEYAQRLVQKLTVYAHYGIIEGKNLVLIREEAGKLDSGEIDRVIRKNFTLDRYERVGKWLAVLVSHKAGTRKTQKKG